MTSKAVEIVQKFGWRIAKHCVEFLIKEGESLVYEDHILDQDEQQKLIALVESYPLLMKSNFSGPAVQFIRDWGIDHGRVLLGRLSELGCSDDMKFGVVGGMWHRTSNGCTYSELNHVIDCWEMVESFNGIEGAKSCWEHEGGGIIAESVTLPCGKEVAIDVLKNAVNVVEQING